MFECEKDRKKSCEIHVDLVTRFADRLITGTSTIDDYKAELSLFDQRLKLQNAEIKNILVNIEEQLSRCPSYLTQGHGLSYQDLSNRIGFSHIASILESLEPDDAFRPRLEEIKCIVSAILMLLKQYCTDFQAAAIAFAQIWSLPPKTLSVHYNSSFLHMLLPAINEYTDEISRRYKNLETNHLKQYKNVIESKYRDFCRKLQTTVRGDVENCRLAYQALTEKSQEVPKFDQDLVALTQEADAILCGDKKIHIVPVTHAFLLRLNGFMDNLAQHLMNQVETDASRYPKCEGTIQKKRPVNTDAPQGLSYMDILLRSGMQQRDLQKEKISNEKLLVKQLSADERRLKQQIYRECQSKDRIYKQAFAGDPTAGSASRFVEDLAQKQVFDFDSAKFLVDIETHLDKLKCNRNQIVENVHQLRNHTVETKKNTDILDKVLTYFKQWEKRQSLWMQYIKEESWLLSAHRDLRVLFYKDVDKATQRWKNLTTAELRVAQRANVILAKKMFQQMSTRIIVMEHNLRSAQRKILANISARSRTLRKRIQSISALPQPNFNSVLDVQYQLKACMEEIETFWRNRFQFEQLHGMREGQKYLLSFVQKLLSDLENNQSTLYLYIEKRQHMTHWFNKKARSMGRTLLD